MTATERTGQAFEIPIPLMATPRSRSLGPPLTANMRLHHMARASRVRTVREQVALAVGLLRIPPGSHVTVTLHYAPGDNRRCDSDNLDATRKPACDGLVDAGVVPDDTPRWMSRPEPVIHPGRGVRRLWLAVQVTP